MLSTSAAVHEDDKTTGYMMSTSAAMCARMGEDVTG